MLMHSNRDEPLPCETVLAGLLRRPFHPHQHPSVHRLTISVLPFTSEGQLLLVLPKDALDQGWIPLQGGVNPGETLVAAVVREANEECGIGAQRLSTVMQFLGHHRSYVQRQAAEVVKDFVGMFVEMPRWVEPCLDTRENRNWAPVNNYAQLAEMTAACSPNKKMAIARFLSRAVKQVPRFKNAWGDLPLWYKRSMVAG